jgi:hypothetical protein
MKGQRNPIAIKQMNDEQTLHGQEPQSFGIVEKTSAA